MEQKSPKREGPDNCFQLSFRDPCSLGYPASFRQPTQLCEAAGFSFPFFLLSGGKDCPVRFCSSASSTQPSAGAVQGKHLRNRRANKPEALCCELPELLPREERGGVHPKEVAGALHQVSSGPLASTLVSCHKEALLGKSRVSWWFSSLADRKSLWSVEAAA